MSADDISNQASISDAKDPINELSQDSSIVSKNLKGKIDKKMIESSLNHILTLEDVFQYCWPPESLDSKNKDVEYWMIQENLANFMNIKGFKRRFPDLYRRKLQAQETDWLVKNNLVSQEFADLGLTALKAEEVMELLQKDFPEIYSALHELFSRRKVQEITERQKRQYQAARIERNSQRAENARKKAIQSARKYNRELLRTKVRERRYYWDLQTMQIHVPRRTITKYEDKPDRSKLDYPVAIIPGQYCDHYRIYTPEQLKFLPLSRAVHLNPLNRPLRVPNIANYDLKYSKIALEARKEVEQEKQRKLEQAQPALKTLDEDMIKAKIEAAIMSQQKSDSPKPQPQIQEVLEINSGSDIVSGPAIKCTTCGQLTHYYVKCSECTKQGHPNCLQLPDSMVEVVGSYQWACIDCKMCTQCEDASHEDLMMFCDRCDRGFHAFCVGLRAIPQGRWECPRCTGKPCPTALPKPAPSRSSKRSTPASKKRRGSVVDKDLAYSNRGTPSSKRRASNSRRTSNTAILAEEHKE
ncbi:PHD finger protein 10 [Cichlidogyrus casuarinus]|uniref:PHD finger protein 10 n=1 Tax=Cichlidogyrus casuarinus TaxID=1844966 RepID=A0ABD2PZX0_9PLAT